MAKMDLPDMHLEGVQAECKAFEHTHLGRITSEILEAEAHTEKVLDTRAKEMTAFVRVHRATGRGQEGQKDDQFWFDCLNSVLDDWQRCV